MNDGRVASIIAKLVDVLKVVANLELQVVGKGKPAVIVLGRNVLRLEAGDGNEVFLELLGCGVLSEAKHILARGRFLYQCLNNWTSVLLGCDERNDGVGSYARGEFDNTVDLL